MEKAPAQAPPPTILPAATPAGAYRFEPPFFAHPTPLSQANGPAKAQNQAGAPASPNFVAVYRFGSGAVGSYAYSLGGR